MKLFELAYVCTEPVLPAIRRKVRIPLLKIARSYPCRPKVLDIGGRNPHYTIGVPADITITDLYRETKFQEKLNLGINQEIIDLIYKKRSNVKKVIIDDMTHSTLPDCSFDIAVAVEVLRTCGRR